MKRRESLKAIAIGTVATGTLLQACKTEDEKAIANPSAAKKDFTLDRMKEEEEHYQKLIAETFFTPEEMATIATLSNIIIPADEVSGSATDAGVPAFIEFIVKDMPQHQVPMRGGLRWLDLHCIKAYGKAFTDITDAQRIEVVETIAYPNKAKADMAQGVAFFSLMRNLTATGFYTSEIGVKDIGYAGNKPNQWNGVPDEVLAQYKLAYTEKELAECVKFDV